MNVLKIDDLIQKLEKIKKEYGNLKLIYSFLDHDGINICYLTDDGVQVNDNHIIGEKSVSFNQWQLNVIEEQPIILKTAQSMVCDKKDIDCTYRDKIYCSAFKCLK